MVRLSIRGPGGRQIDFKEIDLEGQKLFESQANKLIERQQKKYFITFFVVTF
jgi:hypothetical protein